MSIYLHDIPLEEAQARFAVALVEAGLGERLASESLALDERAAGRVLAEPVWAGLSSPHYHASAMDGFAVRAEDTQGAAPSLPVTLDCPRQAGYLDTGDVLPEWANAVIPIESVEPLDEAGAPAQNPRHPEHIRIRAAVVPWQHVRPMGEDIVATQLVLPAGWVLRPVDLGAAAASGQTSLNVVKKPRVAIIPTGTELVPVGAPPRPGEIIEYNSLVLAAQVNGWGGEALRLAPLPDDFEQIRAAVLQAARDHDLVLVNAGSSAGSEDFTARVVESLGRVLVHGVAVRPGHPVILGMLRFPGEEAQGGERQVPVIGVPGYPVSAALTGDIFVKPLLERWLGVPHSEPDTLRATLTRKVTSPAGDDDFLRVVLGRVGARLLAAPLARGAGVITSLVQADGITLLPRGSQGAPAGAEVEVHLYKPRSEIERTIFAIGSHDISLDLMAQFLAPRGRRLVSANVGSLGGLVALRRAEAHLGGCHLLDERTGEYNQAYIREYLPETRVKLVTLVGRQQGLLLPPGNPLNIRSLEDLVRPEITFVNRQRGAGTRLLLDYHLRLLGIVPERLKGYNQEEYTHLAVAAAVASGRASCGLGIAAAARALGLEFLPLYEERYDLAILEEYYSSALLAPLLELLQETAFRSAVAGLPGYDIRRMGELVAEF